MVFGQDTTVEKLQSQLQVKSRQLDNAESLVNKFKTEIEENKKINAHLTKTLHLKEAACNELTATTAQLQREAKQRTEQIHFLQQQLESASRRASNNGQGSLAGAPAQQLARTASTSAENAEIRALQQQLLSLQQELIAVKGGRYGDPAKLATDCDVWKQRCESLKTELAAVQKRFQLKEASEADLRAQCSSLKETVGRMEGSLASTRTEMASLHEALSSNKKEHHQSLERTTSGMAIRLEKQSQMYSELQAKLREESEEKIRLGSSLDSLQHHTLELEAKLKDTAVELVQVQSALDHKQQLLESLQAENKQGASTRSMLEQQLASLQQNLQQSQRSHQETTTQLSLLRDDLDRALQKGEDLEEQLKSAKERYYASHVAIEKLKAQLAEKDKEVEAKERMLMEVAEGSDQKQVQLDKFQQMSVSKANGEATLKQLLHDARDAAAALKSELAVKDMEIAQLADELLTAKNTIANFSGPGGLQDDLQRAQSTIEAVKTRSAQEVEQLNSLLQSRGSQFDSMAAQVERLQAELKEAHHAQGLAQQQLQQLEIRLQAAGGSHDEVQQHLAVVLARADRLQGTLDERDLELKQGREKMEQMEVLLEQMHVLNKQMEEGQDALRLANHQFASLADELTEAQEALSAKEMSFDSSQDVLRAKDRKMSQMQTELATQAAMIASLEQQVKDWQEKGVQFERAIASLELQLSDMRGVVRQKEDEMKQVSKELDQTQLESLHYQRELNNTTGALSDAQRKIDRLMDHLADLQAEAKGESDLADRMKSIERDLMREREAHAATRKQLPEGGAEDVDRQLFTNSQSPTSSPPLQSPITGRRSSIGAKEAAAMRNHIISLERQLVELQMQAVEHKVADLEARSPNTFPPFSHPCTHTAAPADAPPVAAEVQEDCRNTPPTVARSAQVASFPISAQETMCEEVGEEEDAQEEENDSPITQNGVLESSPLPLPDVEAPENTPQASPSTSRAQQDDVEGADLGAQPQEVAAHASHAPAPAEETPGAADGGASPEPVQAEAQSAETRKGGVDAGEACMEGRVGVDDDREEAAFNGAEAVESEDEVEAEGSGAAGDAGVASGEEGDEGNSTAVTVEDSVAATKKRRKRRGKGRK